MRYNFLLLMLVAFYCPISASADQLTYYIAKGNNLNGISKETGRHRSPSQACDAIAAMSNYQGVRTVAMDCMYTHPTTGQYWNIGRVKKYDESCDLGIASNGTECLMPPADNAGQKCGGTDAEPLINNSKGECVSLPRADTPAICKYLGGSQRFGNLPVAFNDNGSPIPPVNASYAGCSVDVLTVDHCKQPAPRSSCSNGNCISMQSSTANCRVTMDFNGQPAGDGSGSPLPPSGSPTDSGLCLENPSQCTPKDAPNTNDSQPCTYVTDAEGRQSCSSWNYHGSAGNGGACGSFNGEFRCDWGKKGANSTGNQIDTTVQTQDNGDGTTSTIKTDTHQQTICKGANACVTQTTTNKSVTIKNGNGDTISSSGSCTGPNCTTGGSGSDGSGLKPCVAAGNCGAEDETTDGGLAETEGGPELEDVASFADTTRAYFSRISNSPIGRSVTGLSVPTGGTCPVYSASTMIGTLDTSAFCDLAPQILTGLRFLFLALWAWTAIRLFMTA